MAGLSDTPEGGETRRNGDTVGLPHAVPDGTRLEDLSGDDQPEPGMAVTYDGTNISKAATGDDIIGVLVNYGNVYGASHQGEKIDGDVDATVAVSGTYSARAEGSVFSGGESGVTGVGSHADGNNGEFGINEDQGFRVVDVDTSPSGYDLIEVLL